MQIEITQRHINEGTQRTGRDCAIARALIEQGARNVWVGHHVLLGAVARVNGGEFVLGKEAEEFIQKFDENKSLVSPITITLTPSPYFPHSHNMPTPEYAYSTYASLKPMMVYDEVATMGEMPKITMHPHPVPKFTNVDYGY